MVEAAETIPIRSEALNDAEQRRFSALVEEHARLVYAICLAVLRNHADAEDAAQECFLRLIRHRVRLAMALDKRAFIARVAQRCALDRLQRRPAEEPLEDVHADPRESALGEDQDLAAVARAITSLPEELRRVIELTQSGELTSEQIGKVLGIPAATVRSRLARAKSLLREKLERRRGYGGR
jgi:RNA polymerase sigma-70 factor, ECF subfamily